MACLLSVLPLHASSTNRKHRASSPCSEAALDIARAGTPHSSNATIASPIAASSTPRSLSISRWHSDPSPWPRHCSARTPCRGRGLCPSGACALAVRDAGRWARGSQMAHKTPKLTSEACSMASNVSRRSLLANQDETASGSEPSGQQGRDECESFGRCVAMLSEYLMCRSPCAARRTRSATRHSIGSTIESSTCRVSSQHATFVSSEQQQQQQQQQCALTMSSSSPPDVSLRHASNFSTRETISPPRVSQLAVRVSPTASYATPGRRRMRASAFCGVVLRSLVQS
eukprot:3934510-Rhodomonas_salina.3